MIRRTTCLVIGNRFRIKLEPVTGIFVGNIRRWSEVRPEILSQRDHGGRVVQGLRHVHNRLLPETNPRSTQRVRQCGFLLRADITCDTFWTSHALRGSWSVKEDIWNRMYIVKCNYQYQQLLKTSGPPSSRLFITFRWGGGGFGGTHCLSVKAPCRS